MRLLISYRHFGRKLFMVCKIISSKTVFHQNISPNFRSNFFMGRWFSLEILFEYRVHIGSSKTVVHQIFHLKFVVEHFGRKVVYPRNTIWLSCLFSKHYLISYSNFGRKLFLWLQNHFLQKNVHQKFSSKFFGWTFYGQMIYPWNTIRTCCLFWSVC